MIFVREAIFTLSFYCLPHSMSPLLGYTTDHDFAETRGTKIDVRVRQVKSLDVEIFYTFPELERALE